MKIKRNVMWLYGKKTPDKKQENPICDIFKSELSDYWKRATIYGSIASIRDKFNDILSDKKVYIQSATYGNNGNEFCFSFHTNHDFTIEVRPYFNIQAEFCVYVNNYICKNDENIIEAIKQLLDEHANPLCKLLKNYCEDTSGNFSKTEEIAKKFLSILSDRSKMFNLLNYNPLYFKDRYEPKILRLTYGISKYDFHFVKNAFHLFIKEEVQASHLFTNDKELIKHLKLYCYEGGYFHE